MAELLFNVSTLPVTRRELLAIPTPLGAVYTPFELQVPVLALPLQACSGCAFLASGHSPRDEALRMWTCGSCGARNRINGDMPAPASALDVTEEYAVLAAPPPVFVYVVDLLLEAEDLAALVETVVALIELHPPGSLVLLVLFDRVVRVHLLGLAMAQTMCFDGTKTSSKEALVKLLGLEAPRPWDQSTSVAKYAARVDTPEPFVAALQRLTVASWKVAASTRPLRCTGAALATAAALSEHLFVGCVARVLLFVGGPCTGGVGQVVDLPMLTPMRLHHDVLKLRATHYTAAKKFYDLLVPTLPVLTTGRGDHTALLLLVMSLCYDQVGLLELRRLVAATGGELIATDSFTTAIFRQLFPRMFAPQDDGWPGLFGGGVLEVVTSAPALKVSGIVGHCHKAKHHTASVAKMNAYVLDEQVGDGLTNVWSLPGLLFRHSYAVFVVPSVVPTEQERSKMPAAVQLQLRLTYRHPDGSTRVRVTTTVRPTLNSGERVEPFQLFDQEAAAVLLAYQLLHRLNLSYSTYPELLKEMDKVTVKLGKTFAQGVSGNLRLDPRFEHFPQFAYHLRRSPLVRVFGLLPDETALYHHALTRAHVDDAMLMVQPLLVQFTPGAEPVPVVLEAPLLRPDCVLLLDAYFYVVVWTGESAAGWRDAGLDPEEYAHVYDMLRAPVEEVRELLAERFPLPRYVATDAGKSQARFLASRLDPPSGGVLTEGLHLEDASFAEYFQGVMADIGKA